MSSLMGAKMDFVDQLEEESDKIIDKISKAYNKLPASFDRIWKNILVPSVKPPDILSDDDISDCVDEAKERVIDLIHAGSKSPVQIEVQSETQERRYLDYPDISEIQGIQMENSVTNAVSLLPPVFIPESDDNSSELPDTPQPTETHSEPTSPILEKALRSEVTTDNASVASAPTPRIIIVDDDRSVGGRSDISIDHDNNIMSSLNGIGNTEFLNRVMARSDRMTAMGLIKKATSCQHADVATATAYMLEPFYRYSGGEHHIWNESTKLWNTVGIESISLTVSNLMCLIGEKFRVSVCKQIQESSDVDFKANAEILAKKTITLISKCKGATFIKMVCSGFLKALVTDVNFEGLLNKQYGYLLPVRGGICINLRTGEAIVREPEHMFKSECDAKYDPNVKSRVVRDFFHSLYGWDPELEKYMIKKHGYDALGVNPEQKMWFHQDENGANGKSTVMKLQLGFFGDMAEEMDPKLLAPSKNESQNSHSGNIQGLEGKRVCIISESDTSMKMNEAFLKRMSGEDMIKGRKVGSGDKFKFSSFAKLNLACNPVPDMPADSKPLWRRTKIVPYPIIFVSEETRLEEYSEISLNLIKTPNLELSEQLSTDEARSEYLNLIIEGAGKYFTEGLKDPKTMIEAKNTFRRKLDVLGEFIEENFIKSTGDYKAKDCVQCQVFHRAYLQWRSKHSHYEKISSQNIGVSMNSRNYRKIKSGNDFHYTPLVMRIDSDYYVEPT
jgi:P4 family phage/plasmid primase-like protien